MKKTKEELAQRAEYQAKLRDLLGNFKGTAELEAAFCRLKKDMIELMYDEELKQHLGFNKNEQKAGGRPNYRNGTSKKTVRSCNGPIELYGWLRKAGRVCGKVGWEVPVHQQVVADKLAVFVNFLALSL